MTLKVYLDRTKSDENGTFGELSDETGDLQHVYTIERPKTGDHPCIPAGIYRVTQFDSPSKGDVWLVNDVPGRSMIEIHPANLASQLLGCIAVGDSLGCIDGEPAVLDSKATFTMLKKVLPDEFELHIDEELA